MKKNEIVTGQCPHCKGPAMLGYKHNPRMGKCANLDCHKVFFIKEERAPYKVEPTQFRRV